jgi:hypothetical protein
MITQTLYDRDFNLWIEETISWLREQDWEQIDRENLIEELESTSRSEKNALKSNARILLMHLLKWKYQASRRSNSWKSTITEHRTRIQDSFESSPSLVNYFEEVLGQCYQSSRRLASVLSFLPNPTYYPFLLFVAYAENVGKLYTSELLYSAAVGTRSALLNYSSLGF